jgi:hypothetical protein
MMTGDQLREFLIVKIERKLKRRRLLNSDEMRASRGAMAPPPQAIALTFKEAEAVLRVLRCGSAGIPPDKDEAL